MGKSHGNRFFPSAFFHSQNPLRPRDSIWSKWSSYDVPKARGLHLHSLGRKPWWTQDGSVDDRQILHGGFHWGPTKNHIFFSDVVIILTPFRRNRLQTQRPILDVWGKMGIIIKSGTAFFVMNPMESEKNHQRNLKTIPR